MIDIVKELKSKGLSFNEIAKKLEITEYAAIKLYLPPEEWAKRYSNKKHTEVKRTSRYLERGLCACCGDRPIAPGNRYLCHVCYRDSSEESASVGFMSSRKGHSL